MDYRKHLSSMLIHFSNEFRVYCEHLTERRRRPTENKFMKRDLP